MLLCVLSIVENNFATLIPYVYIKIFTFQANIILVTV